MVARHGNPAWWDRVVDLTYRRRVGSPWLILLVLWSVLVVVAVGRSFILGMCAVVSLPLVLLGFLVGSRAATAPEQRAFADSFSENDVVAQAAEAEWRRLHARRDAQTAPLRGLRDLGRRRRPSLRAALILVGLEGLIAIVVNVVLAVRGSH